MKEKIVFFGAGPYVTPVIEVLNSNFDLLLVVTTEKNPNDPVLKFCTQHNLRYISAPSSSEIINNLQSIINDCKVAVLAYFGIIVSDEVLNLFSLGIINIHPSLLPKYRGPTPIQTAIINDGKTTGVTIMKLDDKVDHGPVLAQAEDLIEEKDTSETVYKRLFKKGADLLVEVLPQYLSGDSKPREQDHSQATYTETLTRESGFIDINKPPDNKLLDRMIRAYHPWPGVWFKTELNGAQRIIKLLPENRIHVEGKNPMSLKDFENGYSKGKEILSKLKLNG